MSKNRIVLLTCAIAVIVLPIAFGFLNYSRPMRVYSADYCEELLRFSNYWYYIYLVYGVVLFLFGVAGNLWIAVQKKEGSTGQFVVASIICSLLLPGATHLIKRASSTEKLHAQVKVALASNLKIKSINNVTTSDGANVAKESDLKKLTKFQQNMCIRADIQWSNDKIDGLKQLEDNISKSGKDSPQN